MFKSPIHICFKINKRRLYFVCLLSISNLFLYACGSSESTGGDTGGGALTYTLYISNKSQFELENVFVYKEHLTYDDDSVVSINDAPLAINDYVEVFVETGEYYYVTVTRPPNQYLPLNAYTIAYPVTLDQDSTLVYFDSQYRLEYTLPN